MTAARQSLILALSDEAAKGWFGFPGVALNVTGDTENWLSDMPALDVEDRIMIAAKTARLAGDATMPGPHSSEFQAQHLASGAMASHCSTGQQKAMLIAVILAHARLQEKRLRRVPVMLFDDVAAHLLYITIAMVVGFFSVGVIMERLARVGISNLAVASTYCLLALLALVVIMLEWQLPSLFAWLVFGFFGGAGFLFYPLLCGYFKEELAGRVVTSANVLTFGGAFVAQWAIGAVINQWPVIENGNFHPAGYQAGFALFGGMTLISLIWVILAPGTKRSTRAAS